MFRSFSISIAITSLLLTCMAAGCGSDDKGSSGGSSGSGTTAQGGSSSSSSCQTTTTVEKEALNGKYRCSGTMDAFTLTEAEANEKCKVTKGDSNCASGQGGGTQGSGGTTSAAGGSSPGMGGSAMCDPDFEDCG
jgi:hypothetical protein